jgi:hypothetical protein
MSKPQSLFATLLLVGLTSCGGNEPCDPTSPLCGGGGTTGTPTIAISAPSNSMDAIGATIQLTATVTNTTATPTWTSSNNAVVTVSATGLATAVSNGSATITATVAAVSATSALTVSQVVTSVTVTPSTLALEPIGATGQLTGTAVDRNSNEVASATVVWASSDDGIATVSATGLVTAVAQGSATVTASASGQSGNAAIDVTVPVETVPPTVVAVTPDHEAFEISLDDVISVEFSEDMDPASITISTITVTGPSGAIAGSVSSGGNVATFTPNDPLPGIVTLAVTVTTGVTDVVGNHLASPFTSVFSTQPDPERWYSLTNSFLGPDVRFQTNGTTCTMLGTSDVTGEYWRFVPIGGGRYHLRSLDGGQSRQIEGGDGSLPCDLQPTGSWTGMNWSVTPISGANGYFRLTNENFGSAKSLDTNPEPRMLDSGNFSGQFWMFTDLGPVTSYQFPEPTFVHTATVINGNTTDLVPVQSDPASIVLVTQNWNPPGGSGVLNDASIGVWYAFSGAWGAFNQNVATMPLDAAFNVLLADRMGVSSFVATQTVLSYTMSISHSAIDGNPNALVFVTPVWNPGGVGGIYNDHPIGVWYDGATWNIYNEDILDIAVGAAFNVVVANPSSNAYTHVATSGTISGSETLLDHPLLNGHPDAMITVTQNYSSVVGGGFKNNPNNIAVWYNGSQWSIFNQNGAAMPVDATFNILIDDGFEN